MADLSSRGAGHPSDGLEASGEKPPSPPYRPLSPSSPLPQPQLQRWPMRVTPTATSLAGTNRILHSRKLFAVRLDHLEGRQIIAGGRDAYLYVVLRIGGRQRTTPFATVLSSSTTSTNNNINSNNNNNAGGGGSGEAKAVTGHGRVLSLSPQPPPPPSGATTAGKADLSHGPSRAQGNKTASHATAGATAAAAKGKSSSSSASPSFRTAAPSPLWPAGKLNTFFFYWDGKSAMPDVEFMVCARSAAAVNAQRQTTLARAAALAALLEDSQDDDDEEDDEDGNGVNNDGVSQGGGRRRRGGGGGRGTSSSDGSESSEDDDDDDASFVRNSSRAGTTAFGVTSEKPRPLREEEEAAWPLSKQERRERRHQEKQTQRKQKHQQQQQRSLSVGSGHQQSTRRRGVVAAEAAAAEDPVARQPVEPAATDQVVGYARVRLDPSMLDRASKLLVRPPKATRGVGSAPLRLPPGSSSALASNTSKGRGGGHASNPNARAAAGGVPSNSPYSTAAAAGAAGGAEDEPPVLTTVQLGIRSERDAALLRLYGTLGTLHFGLRATPIAAVQRLSEATAHGAAATHGVGATTPETEGGKKEAGEEDEEAAAVVRRASGGQTTVEGYIAYQERELRALLDRVTAHEALNRALRLLLGNEHTTTMTTGEASMERHTVRGADGNSDPFTPPLGTAVMQRSTSTNTMLSPHPQRQQHQLLASTADASSAGLPWAPASGCAIIQATFHPLDPILDLQDVRSYLEAKKERELEHAVRHLEILRRVRQLDPNSRADWWAAKRRKLIRQHREGREAVPGTGALTNFSFSPGKKARAKRETTSGWQTKKQGGGSFASRAHRTFTFDDAEDDDDNSNGGDGAAVPIVSVDALLDNRGARLSRLLWSAYTAVTLQVQTLTLVNNTATASTTTTAGPAGVTPTQAASTAAVVCRRWPSSGFARSMRGVDPAQSVLWRLQQTRKGRYAQSLARWVVAAQEEAMGGQGSAWKGGNTGTAHRGGASGGTGPWTQNRDDHEAVGGSSDTDTSHTHVTSSSSSSSSSSDPATEESKGTSEAAEGEGEEAERASRRGVTPPSVPSQRAGDGASVRSADAPDALAQTVRRGGHVDSSSGTRAGGGGGGEGGQPSSSSPPHPPSSHGGRGTSPTGPAVAFPRAPADANGFMWERLCLHLEERDLLSLEIAVAVSLAPPPPLSAALPARPPTASSSLTQSPQLSGGLGRGFVSAVRTADAPSAGDTADDDGSSSRGGGGGQATASGGAVSTSLLPLQLPPPLNAREAAEGRSDGATDVGQQQHLPPSSVIASAGVSALPPLTVYDSYPTEVLCVCDVSGPSIIQQLALYEAKQTQRLLSLPLSPPDRRSSSIGGGGDDRADPITSGSGAEGGGQASHTGNISNRQRLVPVFFPCYATTAAALSHALVSPTAPSGQPLLPSTGSSGRGGALLEGPCGWLRVVLSLSPNFSLTRLRALQKELQQQQQQQQLGMPMTMMMPSMPGGVPAAVRYMPPQCWLPNSVPNTRVDGQPYPVANSSAAPAAGNTTSSLQEQQQQQWVLTSQFTATDVQEASRTAHENSGTFPLDTASYDDGEAAAPMPAAFMPKAKPPSSIQYTGRGEGGDAAVAAGAEGELRGYAYTTPGSTGDFSTAHKGAANAAGVPSARAVSPVIANMEWAAVAAAASTASAAAAAAATASSLPPSVSPYQRTQLSTPATATQAKGVEGRDELLSSLPTAPTGGLVLRIDQVCASPPLSSSSVVSSSQTPSSARGRAGAVEGLTLGREYYAVLSFPSWSAVRGPSATAAAAAEAAQSLPPALLFQARSSRAVRDAQGTSSSATAKAGGVAAATATDRGSSGRHVPSAAATRLHGHGLRMSSGGAHKAPSDGRHCGVVAAWADAVYVLEACGPYVGLPLRVDILEAPAGPSTTPSSSPPSNTVTNSSGRDAAVPGDAAVSEAAGAVPRLVGSFVFHYSTLPFVGRHRFPLVPPLATCAAMPHSTSTVPADPSTDSPISHTATAAVSAAVSGGGEAGVRHARDRHDDGTHSGSSPLTITLAWSISPELQQQCLWRRLRRLHRESLVPFAVSEAGVRWVYDRVRHVTVDSSITANISSKSSLPLGRGGGEEEEDNVEVDRGDGMNGWAHQHGWMGDASGVRSAAAGAAAASPTTTVRPSEVAALTVFATPAGLTNANDTMQTQRSEDAQLRTLAMQPERSADHLDDFFHASSTLPPRTSSQLHTLSQRRPPFLTLPQPALDRAVPRSQQGDDADGVRREHTSPPRAQSDVVDGRGGIGSETQRGGGQYYRREGERREGEGRLGGQGTGLQPLSTLEYNTKGMRSNSDSGSSSSSNVGGGGNCVPVLPPARTPRVPADYLEGYPDVAQGRYLSGGHGRRYPQRAPTSRPLHNSTSRSYGRRNAALLNSHSKRVHRPPPAEASSLRLRVTVLSLQNVRLPQSTVTTRTSPSSPLRLDSGASLTPYVVVSYQGSSSSKDNYSLSLPAVEVSGGYNGGNGGGGGSASGALMYFTVEFGVPSALRLQLCHLVTVEVRDVLTRRVFGVAHVPVLIPAEGVDARGGRSPRLLSGRRRYSDGYEGGLTDSAAGSLSKSNAVAVGDGGAAVPPMFGETVTHVVPLCRYVRELQSTRAANHNDNSRHGIVDTDEYHINGTNGYMRNSFSPFATTAARSAGEEAIAPVVGEVTVLTTVLQRPSLDRLLAAHPVCITLTVLGARGLPCSHRPDWRDGSATLAAEPDAYVVVTVRRCEPLDMNRNYFQDETYAERYDEKNRECDGSDEEDEEGNSAGFSSRQGNAEGPLDGVWSTREYRSLTIAHHRSPLWYLELPPLLCSCPNDHYTFTVFQADDDGFDVCLGECHITAQELLHRRLGTAEGGQQQGEEGRSEWGTSGSFTGGGGGAGQTDATFTSTPQTLVLPLGARSDALCSDGTHEGEEARVIAQDAESVMTMKMMSGGGSRGSLVVEWSCVSAATASAAATAALLTQSAGGVHRAVRAGLPRPLSASFSSGYSAAVVVELQLDAATALALEMTARQRWWASGVRGTEDAPVVLAAISTESEGEERGGGGGDSGSFSIPGHRTLSVSHSEGLGDQYHHHQQQHLSYNSGHSRGSTMPGYKIVAGTLQLDSAVVYHTRHRHHQHDGRQSSRQQSISRDGTSFSESSRGDSETAFVSMNATFPSSLVIPFSLRSPPSPIRIELLLRYPNDDNDDNAHRDGAASAAHLSSSSYASVNYAGRASNTSQLGKLSTSTAASAVAVNTLVPSDVFLGEVTLHAASLTPCASPLQDPAPSTLLLRPRRDPRYRTSDVQRANRFAAGLGTVSLRAAVYPLRVYEARMRHQAQQRGWRAQLMVAVQDATDFESEGVYGVEVRCEGTGECRRSRVVRDRNPRFRETFAFTLFSATEVVEVRLLEWPGRDEAEEPCVVAVASFTVEAREEKAEGSSSRNMVDSAMVEEQHSSSGISTGSAAAVQPSSVLQPPLVHTAWLTLQPVAERRDMMGPRVGGGSGNGGDCRAQRMVSPFTSSFSAAGVAPKLLLRWRVRVCLAPGHNTSTVNPVSAVGTRGGLVGTQQGGVSSRQQRSMVPTPPPPAAIRHPRQEPHNAAGGGCGSAGRRRGDTQLQWSDDSTQDRPSAANGISQSAESAAAGYPYALSPPTPPPSSRNHGFNTPPTSHDQDQQYVSADTQRARTQIQAGQSTSRPSVSFTSAPTPSARLTSAELRQPLVLNVLWWSGELLSFLGTGSSTARDVIRFCAARCRRSFTVRGDEEDVDSLSLRPLSMEHRSDEDGGYRGARHGNDDGVNGSSSRMMWLPQDQPLLLYVRNGDYLQVGRQEAAVTTRVDQPTLSGDVERREDENSICVEGRRVEAVDRLTDVRKGDGNGADCVDVQREGCDAVRDGHAQEHTPNPSNSHVRLVAARLSTAPLHMSKANATPVRQQRRLTWLTRRQALAEVNAAVLQQFARHAKEAFLTCKHTSNSSSINPIAPASPRAVSPHDSDSQLAALPTGVRCVVITFLYESVTALPVQLLVQWVQRHRDSLSGFCRPVQAAVRQDFHVMERVFGAAADDAAHTPGQQHNDKNNNNTNDFNGISSSSESISQRQRDMATDGRGAAAGSLTLVDAAEVFVQGSAAPLYAFLCFLNRSTSTRGVVKAEPSAALKEESGTGVSQSPRSSVASVSPPLQSLMVVEEVVGCVPVLRRGVFVQAVNAWEARQVWVRAAQQMTTKEEEKGRGGESATLIPIDEGQGGGRRGDDSTAFFVFTPPWADSVVEERCSCAGGDEEGVLPGYHATDLREGQGGC